MTSNAYIASDGETVMKVGKTNNFWKRMKQIDLPMTAIVSCRDEVTALLIETELRQIAIEMGAIRHPEKIDWFEFDPDIYTMLLAFLESLNGFEPTYYDGIPNNEITLLRKEYVQQLKAARQQMVKEYLMNRDRQEREIIQLKRQVVYLEEERDRLYKEMAALREQHSKELKAERDKNFGQFWEARNWEGKYIELRSYGKTLGFIDENTDI
jgi:hypothetical protein